MTIRPLVCAVALLLAVPSVARAQDGFQTHAALTAYMLAAFGDVAQTEHAIGAGTAKEVNPVLAWSVQKGPITAALVKGSMHTALAWWLLHTHQDHPQRAFWIAVGLASAQLAVDVHNARVTR